MKALNLTGKTFGNLYVLERDYDYQSKSVHKRAYWKCICNCCGKIVSVSSNALSSGNKISCKTNHLEKGEAGFNFLYRNYKNSSKIRNLDFELTKEEFKKLTKGNCFYCGTSPNSIHKKEKDIYIYNGIDRINNSKGYRIDNSVSCCGTCNIAKRKMTQEEFAFWIKKIYNHFILEKEN